MAPRLSPFMRTSDVLIPRQLAPTVGLSHDGFEFLKGSFEGLKEYAVGRMTKSRCGKLYINDEGWGPEAGSIEYGYRVHFGMSYLILHLRNLRIVMIPGCCIHLCRHQCCQSVE